MDDFEAITVFQLGFGPAVAGDDVAIEFYGDAVGLHAEILDQGGEGSRRWKIEIPLIAVDEEFHGSSGS